MRERGKNITARQHLKIVLFLTVPMPLAPPTEYPLPTHMQLLRVPTIIFTPTFEELLIHR